MSYRPLPEHLDCILVAEWVSRMYKAWLCVVLCTLSRVYYKLQNLLPMSVLRKFEDVYMYIDTLSASQKEHGDFHISACSDGTTISLFQQ